MMRYYHDKEAKVVSCAPEVPKTVSTKAGGWKVSAQIDRYKYRRENDAWVAEPDHRHPIEPYPSTDDEEKAIRFFRMNHYPSGEQISADEYYSILEKLGVR